MLTLIEETIDREPGTNFPAKHRGRPSGYRPEYAEQAREYALLGLSNKKIAWLLGIPVPTFDRWLTRFPDLSEKLGEGRANADTEVVKALYRRACGYENTTTHREATWVKRIGVDGKAQLVEIHEKIIETTTYYPPDARAGEKWLRLRQPEWRMLPDKKPLTVADLLALADAAEAAERRYIDAFAERGPDTDGGAAKAGEDG